METLLLIILVGLALAAVRTRDLLGATAILGAYSLVMALLWCVMNALDVGFTEAAVGAGISTVLMLGAIHKIGRSEGGTRGVLTPALSSMAEGLELQSDAKSRWGAIFVCVLVGAALFYGVQDMPQVGDPTAPANSNEQVSKAYIKAADNPAASKNIVTSVLGDYRGYDTMGETVVIFTAALCVMLLLREARPRRRRRKEGPDA